MRKIGTTDNGVLLEMIGSDLIRLRDACGAMDELFSIVEPKAKELPQTNPTEIIPQNIPPAADALHRMAPVRKATPAKVRQAAGGSRICAKCGKPFEAKRKDQRCCSTACGRLYHGPAVKKTAKVKTTPLGNLAKSDPNAFVAPVYVQVAQMLREDGPMTTAEMVKAMFARGRVTTTAKLGVMMSTYKKLFKRLDGHKYGAVEKPSASVLPDPKGVAAYRAQSQSTAAAGGQTSADRIAAIRAADRRAREKAGIQTAAPSRAFGGTDSGIGEPTDDDIAAIRSGRGED